MIAADPGASGPVQVQRSGFFLELSADWLILRASENVHPYLSEYHVTLIGEPLSRFTLAQPLHDLRNLLARQRSYSGIARAYRVRLIDEPRHFDIAFQEADGRYLLEGVPSPDEGFGVWIGSVSRLIDGLGGSSRHQLAEMAARRMRALGGFDRVTLTLADGTAVESSRATATEAPNAIGDLPAIIADTAADPVSIFPRDANDSASRQALMRAPTPSQAGQLRERGAASVLTVPIIADEDRIGEFRCESGTARQPLLELHAAAELFAQVVALRLAAA